MWGGDFEVCLCEGYLGTIYKLFALLGWLVGTKGIYYIGSV